MQLPFERAAPLAIERERRDAELERQLHAQHQRQDQQPAEV